MYVDYQRTVYTAAQKWPSGHVQCCSRLLSKTLHQAAWNYNWRWSRVGVYFAYVNCSYSS